MSDVPRGRRPLDGEALEFTAHDVRLDGTFTKPDAPCSMDADPWCVSAKRMLDTAFPGDKRGYRLADLGCLEGGHAVEFARTGFQVLGVDVRAANIAACRYVKSRIDLPALTFVQDDVWNLDRYGVFAAIFCCGLLDHLGPRPRPRAVRQPGSAHRRGDDDRTLRALSAGHVRRHQDRAALSWEPRCLARQGADWVKTSGVRVARPSRLSVVTMVQPTQFG